MRLALFLLIVPEYVAGCLTDSVAPQSSLAPPPVVQTCPAVWAPDDTLGCFPLRSTAARNAVEGSGPGAIDAYAVIAGDTLRWGFPVTLRPDVPEFRDRWYRTWRFQPLTVQCDTVAYLDDYSAKAYERTMWPTLDGRYRWTGLKTTFSGCPAGWLLEAGPFVYSEGNVVVESYVVARVEFQGTGAAETLRVEMVPHALAWEP